MEREERRIVAVLASPIAFAIVLSSLAAEETSPPPAAVQVRIEPELAVIEGPSLAIDVSLSGRKAVTRSILNKRTAEATGIEGEDFVLVFEGGKKLKGSDFLLEKAGEEAAESGGKRLVLALVHEDLRVRVVTEMRPGEGWATRWLELAGGSGRLEHLSLAEWRCAGAWGPTGPGAPVAALGRPEGIGQPAYVNDLFIALDHPGAENYARGKRICCRLTAYEELGKEPLRPRKLVVGAGEAGGAWQAFLRYIDAHRTVAARMVFLVNDWYWKDKSRPLEALEAFSRVKATAGIPIDSFTLDDGWDFDWDDASGLWGRLGRGRFPAGWDALLAAGRPAGIGVSLWFGPIGGYGERAKRVEFAGKMGFEVNGDKLCLAGPRYRKHVTESFARWASRGMDYIKVDGFWPDCEMKGHGHPTGPGGVTAQMDALMDVFAAWRRARPGLLIGYTSGSNPSPFWLEHGDFLWRGGADDDHAGAGDPFDRLNTYIDSCLQAHRPADLPISAYVTFDLVAPRIAGASEESFERGAWWSMARTSLHHDWYLAPDDLTPGRWKALDGAARWARGHEKLFRSSRMVGGDPRKGDIYGFSAFDEGRGVLSLRNPSAEPRTLERPLSSLLGLPRALRGRTFKLTGTFGASKTLEGVHLGSAALKAELPPLAIAVMEVESEGGTPRY